MKNKSLIFSLGLVLVILLAGSVLGAVSHCCEKRNDGAWCVDADASECDSNFAMEPTACISTSYCKTGTCVNKKDGECVENTPQRGCTEKDGGFWSEGAPADIPQCQLGCCFVGDQAAFVTQTKCKGFASLYGIDTNFQKNIQNEITCIASAQPDVMGACVFEREYETTCKMITKSECKNFGDDTSFYEGVLCTADELATNCAPTEKTTCVEGKDEVFFLDSCGNVANVYDSNMIEKVEGQVMPKDDEGKAYWRNIMAPTCGTSPNAGSPTCGDCNYYDGSTCKKYDRSEDSVKPNYGDNICRSLDCSFDSDRDGEKETYLHGESWCADSRGLDLIDVEGGILSRIGIETNYNLEFNLPGSRYFRMVCYNGEVTTEPCADRRAEVCIQGKITNDRTERLNIDGFRTSVCRVNKWQDCAVQTGKDDCEDSDQRDCLWIADKCAPLFAPGFNFWEEEDESEADICKAVSTTCAGKLEKGIESGSSFVAGVFSVVASFDSRDRTEVIEGSECFQEEGSTGKLEYIESWGENLNNVCASLGDCQGKVSGDTDGNIVKITENYWGFLR